MGNTKGEPTKEKASRGTICTLCWGPVFVIIICLVAWRPILLPRSFKIVKATVSDIWNDKQRFLDNEWQLAHREWRFYQMESRFGQDWCKENTAPRGDVTWLTVAVNDEFVVPVLVLGHSIRTFSCQKNMIVFISEAVSASARRVLRSVGWDTRLVEEMDCNWMDAKVGGDRNSGFFGRPLGHRIKGTHTRFHAWNYTEFSKIIYVDADYMLMTNIDELFDIMEDFAAVPSARPGVLDPYCFNAGLLVFRPDSIFYQRIMKFWWETTEKDTCPTDQDILIEYFTDAGNWKQLPYAYNIRRIVFRPMKSFHFACCRPKPWFAACRPNRKEVNKFEGPILSVDDVVIIFWKNFYELLRKYNLKDWWRSSKFYRPAQEFGVVPYADCWVQTGASNRTKLKEKLTKHVNRTKSYLIKRFNAMLNRTFL